MRPALQPIPLRLYVTMLGRILKWLTIMDASDGVLCNHRMRTKARYNAI